MFIFLSFIISYCCWNLQVSISLNCVYHVYTYIRLIKLEPLALARETSTNFLHTGGRDIWYAVEASDIHKII